MTPGTIQLIVLAGIALFLILKLRGVLGTREGFEKPPEIIERQPTQPQFEVIEGGVDRDITDHVEEGSAVANELEKMKAANPDFSVSQFLQGARGAYEMILMGFEHGEIENLKPFLSDEVFETFSEVIENRKQQGLTIESEFIGVRETKLLDAKYKVNKKLAEITVRFIGETTSVVYDSDGKAVQGSPNEVKQQKDSWTFARSMTSDDPNWKLVATGE
ncbi:MAG: preprotein translocase subunit Tim44 [Rhodobacterales bacterium]|nr:MAG: preprotein translocase subunit Tim44 [Rhodobacterales bacterium]